MRVLHYIGSMEYGGSQAMIMNLYRHIDRNIIQFDFVVHAHEDTLLAQEAKEMGAVIYTCPRFGIKSVGTYQDWWKQFFKEHAEYKIVHCHVRSTAAIVLSVAKKYGCRTISHSHSISSGNGVSGMVKNILQYPIRFIADYFMGCSQVAGEWLFGKRICSSERYYNIRNAIDTEKYIYNHETSQKTRQELGYTNQDFVIGHVGRFSEPKNHMFLIEIFQKLYQRDKKYKLLLVGDGELKEKIDQKIKECGLSNAVQMTGVRTDVQRIMMAMDLFLFPSFYEGLGIVMIEAQATGCPCIASTGVPMAAKITELVSYLSLDEDCEYWAEHLLKINKGERKNMSEAVQQAGYDIKATSLWLQSFYLDVCT